MQELDDQRLRERGVRLLLKRDDLIDAEVPGNKWRKLKYNLLTAEEQGHPTLLTFGGAYSNHVRAVAAAGQACGFRTIGVIRGEHTEPLNWSLTHATSQGMQLTYLDRETYRHKHEAGVLDELRDRFGDFYLLPEGGSNALAVRGCAELPAEITTAFDVICCACGTGGTLAGIASGLKPGQRALGFAVLKGGHFLDDDVAALQQQAFGAATDNWKINQEFHFGGFVKRTTKLDHFIADFQRRHGLHLDWIYVAKMLYGIFALAERGDIPSGTIVIAVVTGPNEEPATP
ncbi:MAG: pyridoxal-phosphate dependent enzyme [Pseudonocardiaceae bacterium]|nr:pyridoxal-phosphate dependent enzyme [Pseudonocardiaceae bacterium]